LITIEVDSALVEEAISRLRRALDDLTPAYEDIGDAIANNIRLGMREGVSPYGDPFAPLKNLRASNKDPRISDVPLNDTRQHIFNKITHQATGEGVEIGLFENQLIGATHQFGSAKKNIPARPFLPIDPNGQATLPAEWEAEVIAIIEAHLNNAI
jgi:phage gpG-like protein